MRYSSGIALARSLRAVVRAVVVLAAVGSSSTVLAQVPAAEGRVGKRVILQYGAVLRSDDPAAEARQTSTDPGRTKPAFRVYRVAQVRATWLKLTAEQSGVQGWARAAEVVPVEQAAGYITNVIRASPRSADYLVDRGMIWGRERAYDKAIADFDEAIGLDPNNDRTYYYRGCAWMAEGRVENAINDLNKAVRLDPANVVYHIDRGVAWGRHGNLDNAITDFDEAIRLDPMSASAYVNRGSAWLVKTEYDKAIADYSETIRLEPQHAAAYSCRGGIWLKLKEYDKAIADLDHAVSLAPSLATAHNGRAWILATCPDGKFRDGAKAVEAATKACTLTEWKHAESIDTLAAASAEAGDFAQAIALQEKANGMFNDGEARKRGAARIELYREKQPYREP